MTAEEAERKSALNRAAHVPRRVNLLDVGKQHSKPGPPKVVKPKHPTEHQEQWSVVLWADFQFPIWGLDPFLLAAIPNGGQRHPAVGRKMKAEGLRAGYPDLTLDVPMNGYHGLRIEMKALDGTIQDSQQQYAEILKAQGYAHAFCYGAAAAKMVIANYLGKIL